MSTETEDVAYLKNILLKIKSDLYDLNGRLNRKLFSEALDTFSVISEKKIFSLSGEVYDLLSSSEEAIRAEAVATLGYGMRLHLPEFRDQAYAIFLHDPSKEVKCKALLAWASYFINTNDKNVLNVLYKIFIDDAYDIDIRSIAYSEIFSVCKGGHLAFDPLRGITPLLKTTTHAEFNSIANWQAIEEIMRKYAPEALVR